MINEIFSPKEVEVIYSIPLSKMGVEDKLIWEFSNNGIFPVKNAYHLAHSRKRCMKGETSRHFAEDAN